MDAVLGFEMPQGVFVEHAGEIFNLPNATAWVVAGHSEEDAILGAHDFIGARFSGKSFTFESGTQVRDLLKQADRKKARWFDLLAPYLGSISIVAGILVLEPKNDNRINYMLLRLREGDKVRIASIKVIYDSDGRALLQELNEPLEPANVAKLISRLF